MKVGFICHGNINRSKLAEVIFRQICPQVDCCSYAVGEKSSSGKLFASKMRKITSDNNYLFEEERSKKATQSDLEELDLVYIMDKKNYKHMLAQYDLSKLNIRYFGHLIERDEIPDPGFAKGTELHQLVFQIIEECCLKLKEEIENED